MPNSTQESECIVNREDKNTRSFPTSSLTAAVRQATFGTAAARTRVETMSHRERATNSVWNCIESNVSGPHRAVWPPDEQSVKPSAARVAGRCASSSGNMRRYHSPPDQQRRTNERHKFNGPQCACAEFSVGLHNSSPRHLALSNSSSAHRGRQCSSTIFQPTANLADKDHEKER